MSRYQEQFTVDPESYDEEDFYHYPETDFIPEPVQIAGLDFGAEDGIATAEFSIVTLAAVGFAGLLVTILASGEVRELLLGMVRNALGG